MAVTLIFVRHGESESNYEHRFAGQSDAFGLTERGHAQARAAADALAQIPVDAVLSSDLRRAYDTAKHIADRHNLPVIPDAQFREIYAGQWEGKRYDTLPLLYPQDFGIWLSDIGRAVCTGGESVAEFQQRIRQATEKTVRVYPNQTVVIGTHAVAIRAMQCLWQKLPLSCMKDIPWVANASLTTVIYEDDLTWHSVVIGQTEHLCGNETLPPKNV